MLRNLVVKEVVIGLSHMAFLLQVMLEMFLDQSLIFEHVTALFCCTIL